MSPRPAEAAGWQVRWRIGDTNHMLALRDPGYRGHEAAQLMHPSLNVTIDVHRRIFNNNHNRFWPGRARQRLTDAAWKGAKTAVIAGVPVRMVSPEDAIVFGLALNRCWGSDDWRIKPRDYRDAQALVQRFALTGDAVRLRARHLGVSRTVDLFLRRCDPWRRRVQVEPPTWLDMRAWNLAVLRQRGPRGLIVVLNGARDVRRQARTLATALPCVLRAHHQLRRHSRDHVEPPRAIATANRPLRPFGRRDTLAARRGVHRILGLLAVRSDVGALTALALEDALRRQDYAAVAEIPASGAERPRLWLDGAPLALHTYPRGQPAAHRSS